MSINSDFPDYLFLNKNNSVKSIKTSRSSSKKNIINSKNFLEKLDFYSEKKKENTDKIKLMSESSLINECTFKPSLNYKYKYKRSYSKNNVRKDNNNNYNNCNRKYKTNENNNTQRQLLI